MKSAAETQDQDAFAGPQRVITHEESVRESTRLAAARTQKMRGQKFYGMIKKTSKYFGQSKEFELFPIYVMDGFGQYLVHGGPGGRYRLEDVFMFAHDESGDHIQITF